MLTGVYELQSCEKYLRFLDCIDEIDKERETLSDVSYVEENKLIEYFLAVNDEETIMIMLERGYYSGELLDVLIARCMNNQYVRLVPMLIYYKEKEKEGKACIQ